MKAYIVTLFDIPESVEVADRALHSARGHGIDAQCFPGVWRDIALKSLEMEGLKQGTFDETWSNTPAAMGNFVAQYRIWKEIEHSGPAIIMEHDSVVVAPIPDLTGRGDIINLGKPSFGKLRKPLNPGFYPLFSSGDKIPGAHGYYLTPAGATALVSMAKRKGAIPVDKFICPQRFTIAEYYPWPIEAHDTFTTIQRVKGCLSKHAYAADPTAYKIYNRGIPPREESEVRELTGHKVNPANDVLKVIALDEPGIGGANHVYTVEVPGGKAPGYTMTLHFQNGPIGEAGVNGLTHEVLLAILVDRLEAFQKGPFAGRENAIALTKIQEAQHWLHHTAR